jgi:hypothetical protein
VLSAVIAYEKGSFDEIEIVLPPELSLRDAYVDALAWTEGFRAEMTRTLT